MALDAKGFEVAIIDRDKISFEQRLYGDFSGKKLVGVGFDREAMEAAGIRGAEIFVSATRGDNTNIVSARIAKEHYAVPKVAALIYDPRRAVIYERLGITTVATVLWATDQILARLLPSAAMVEWTIGSGEVVVIGVPAPPGYIGRPLAELRQTGKVDVVAVTRLGTTQLPTPKTIIQQGDFLHLVVLRSSIGEVEEKLAYLETVR
jgi:trk system potassium uptake protein